MIASCSPVGHVNDFAAGARAAASLGAFDIIGVSATDVLLVQVKSNRMPSAIELETIKLFACPPNARKLIHVWQDRKRLPRVLEV